MEASQGSSNSPPPFLIKTYDMVDDPSTDNIVSWSRTHASFIVWNPPEFSRDLLPKYFKHNNFSSFVRQLNTYGFRKIDPDQWEFANDDFIRGRRHLLKNIHRRKPIHSHSLHNSSAPLAEAEKQELQEEIEKLKHEKGSLVSELQRHTQQQHGMERQMQSLEERLQNVENRQRTMMNFLAQIVQRPGFLSNFVQQSDLHSKKRRLPKTNYFYDDADMEENRIVSFQPAGREKADVSSVHLLDIEPFDRMESTLISLENFFRDVSHASGEDMYFDSALPCLPPPVVLTEMHTSSGETGVNYRSSSPKVHSPCLRDIHSSPDLAESTSYAESPALPLTDIQTDTRSKVSEIDVNSEPVVPENDLSRDRVAGNAPSSVPTATGVNDVFWQQFLQETPGSSDTHEVQSERRNADDRINEGMTGEHGNISWNRKNVDHLTEKMGHLTSV